MILKQASVEVAAPKSVQRPIEQLLAVLTLTNELLPYVPDCAVQLSGDTSDSEMPSSAADTNLSQSFREEMSGTLSFFWCTALYLSFTLFLSLSCLSCCATLFVFPSQLECMSNFFLQAHTEAFSTV